MAHTRYLKEPWYTPATWSARWGKGADEAAELGQRVSRVAERKCPFSMSAKA